MMLSEMSHEEITNLGIGSIDAVDLAAKLKQLTGQRLTPGVFKKMRTINDIVEAIASSTCAPS